MKRLLALVLALALALTMVSFAMADELVDGKFADTRKITVEIFHRHNDGGSDPADNPYTRFVHDQMLEKYNVDVEFVSAIGRWTEIDDLTNALASGDAPDICVTYSYPTIQNFANMGGVLNLNDIDGKKLEEYKDILPNLWNLLGDNNIFYDQDPETGDLWAIEAILAENARINTFIREDWLKKLDLPLPTTEEEFHDALVAFRDNAELLLGDDAGRMIPYSTSYDVAWRNDHLFAAYIPNDVDDDTLFINGFDDRHLLYPNFKEGVRTLNKWYNEGLVWKDFGEYPSGDTTEDNLMKAGFVGAFQHNWDYPYRGGEDSIAANLKRISDDAAYVAVDCFKNDAGLYRKFLSASVDRKVFFPATNTEPLASLLYLDYISSPEAIAFLQLGEEGTTYNQLESGAYEKIATTGDWIQNSLNNIDYTITVNGLYLGDATAETTALGYEGVDSQYIVSALAASKQDGRVPAVYHVGAIEAESEYGTALPTLRDTILTNAVTTSVENFDAVYDRYMQDYMDNGGLAITNERIEKINKYYGTSYELK